MHFLVVNFEKWYQQGGTALKIARMKFYDCVTNIKNKDEYKMWILFQSISKIRSPMGFQLFYNLLNKVLMAGIEGHLHMIQCSNLSCMKRMKDFHLELHQPSHVLCSGVK